MLARIVKWTLFLPQSRHRFLLATAGSQVQAMPYFDENPLLKLAPQAGEAEAVLDLRGMTQQQAIQAVEELLDRPARAQDYLIRFDPPANDGRETLFLPLGRHLLQARRDGRLSRFLPGSDGAGYFITLPG